VSKQKLHFKQATILIYTLYITAFH